MNTGVPGRRRSLWKAPASMTALILLIPLLGNIGYGWDWDLGAFVRIGTLVFGIGLTYELVTRNVDRVPYRAAVGVALAAFLLVGVNFIQMADDVNPAAVMYFWVPLVGIVGAAMARFRRQRLAWVLFATALADASVLAIVLIRTAQVSAWTPAVLRGFGLNALFAMLFVGSALLFRRAARQESAAGAV